MDFKLINVEISSSIFFLSILRQYVEKKKLWGTNFAVVGRGRRYRVLVGSAL